MFGFKLIKNGEFEKLTNDLADAKDVINTQMIKIDELNLKIVNLEKQIADLTAPAKVETATVEEKPVKKVRRRSSKKSNKKEE